MFFSTVSRILFWLAAFLVVAPTFYLRTSRTDLGIVLAASRNLSLGNPVYRIEDPNEHTKAPLLTLSFIPLTWFPQWLVERAWDVLLVILFFKILLELNRLSPERTVSYSKLAIFVCLLLLNPINKEIRMGQYNLIALALILSLITHPKQILSPLYFSLALRNGSRRSLPARF